MPKPPSFPQGTPGLLCFVYLACLLDTNRTATARVDPGLGEGGSSVSLHVSLSKSQNVTLALVAPRPNLSYQIAHINRYHDSESAISSACPGYICLS